MPGQTPWQTVGPFFHYGLPWRGGADLLCTGSELGARPDLVPPEHFRLGPGTPGEPHAGEAIEIAGAVYDAAGAPVPDAMVEIWQADGEGRYAEPPFIGFGRSATGEDGGFLFRTLKPGRVGSQAPHIAVGLFGRGLLRRLVTRIYFPDEPANAADPVLALVPPHRRDTLVARAEGERRYRFDVRLQGPDEAVFFDI